MNTHLALAPLFAFVLGGCAITSSPSPESLGSEELAASCAYDFVVSAEGRDRTTISSGILALSLHRDRELSGVLFPAGYASPSIPVTGTALGDSIRLSFHTDSSGIIEAEGALSDDLSSCGAVQKGSLSGAFASDIHFSARPLEVREGPVASAQCINGCTGSGLTACLRRAAGNLEASCLCVQGTSAECR